MERHKNIIALCGYARSGKDSLCASLINAINSRGLKAKRFSLADSLKDDLRPFILSNFSIDINACSDEDKELIRPLMISYGAVRRAKSKGQYFTNKLNTKIKYSEFDYGIITDLRYYEFEKDEVQWVRDHNGLIISLNLVKDDNSFLKSSIQEEIENIPKIQAIADFHVEWKKSNSLKYRNEIAENLLTQILQ